MVTWLIWTLTLVAVLALYESVKYLLSLFSRKQLRYRMVLCFLGSVYPHYYAWWAYFNYINDDFYEQCIHQLLFTVTEVCSTVMVLQLADKGVQATPERLVFIIAIAASHVVASGWDQFVSNVLLQEGFMHQILRDLGFMVPDLLNIYLPVQELKEVAGHRRINPAYLVSNHLVVTLLAYIVGFWLLLLVI